ncbi:MAG: hypothetical protein F6K26_45520 [Moorea sp. SIO2I5]|nr:hypothetical protein [Moorena sp. SIO2I5]
MPTISDPMATAMISNGNPTQNQPTKPSSTLAYWPRDRVQPTNLGLLATRSRSTNEPKKRGMIDQLPRGRCLEKVIRKQRKIQVPAVTGK